MSRNQRAYRVDMRSASCAESSDRQTPLAPLCREMWLWWINVVGSHSRNVLFLKAWSVARPSIDSAPTVLMRSLITVDVADANAGIVPLNPLDHVRPHVVLLYHVEFLIAR